MQNDNKHNNTPIDLTGKRLLVVGAGGFIGGFIAAEGVRRGMDVTVAVLSLIHISEPTRLID